MRNKKEETKNHQFLDSKMIKNVKKDSLTSELVALGETRSKFRHFSLEDNFGNYFEHAHSTISNIIV